MGSLTHLAIIMDGNGRWAERRSLPRSAGHLEGGKAALKVIRGCLSHGIGYLTLYCFSTENWKRPKEEIDYLMGLFSSRLRAEMPRMVASGIRLLHLGRREGLPEKVLDAIDEAVERTAGCNALTLQLAINYGGLDEIARAASKAVADGIDSTRGIDHPGVLKNIFRSHF